MGREEVQRPKSQSVVSDPAPTPRLARPVLAKQRMHFAGVNIEVEAIERQGSGKALRNAPNGEQASVIHGEPRRERASAAPRTRLRKTAFGRVTKAIAMRPCCSAAQARKPSHSPGRPGNRVRPCADQPNSLIFGIPIMRLCRAIESFERKPAKLAAPSPSRGRATQEQSQGRRTPPRHCAVRPHNELRTKVRRARTARLPEHHLQLKSKDIENLLNSGGAAHHRAVEGRPTNKDGVRAETKRRERSQTPAARRRRA